MVVIYSVIVIVLDYPNVSWLDVVVLSAKPSLSIAYPVTAAVGLPSYFLLLWLERSSYLAFAITGALIALLYGGFSSDLSPQFADYLLAVILLVSCGALVAIVFRAIAGAPERTSKTASNAAP